MGDPTPDITRLDPTGLKAIFQGIFRRLRNLEKPTGLQVQNGNLKAKSLNTSGDMNAGGNVTGANLSAFGTVGGTNVNASVGVTAPQGTFPTGVTSAGVRTKTLTNSPVQLYVDATGQLGVSASTRAKKDIGTDYNVDMQKFLAIVLKNWQYKDKPFATGMGPIADDLDAAGLTEFVIYNLDGSIQGVRTDMLVIGLMSAYFQSRTITLAEFNKRSVQTKSVTNMAALSLGGTRSYTITWDKPFADATYAVTASVYSSAGVLLSGATAASLPSSRTATGCVVQVTAGVALLAGQTLVVEAVHI